MPITLLTLAALLAVGTTPALRHCELHPANGRWQGSCPASQEGKPAISISLATEHAITTGVWRKDAAPAAVWSGQMGSFEDPEDEPAKVELEIYPGGSGALRTADGWLPVSGYDLSASALRFQVDPSREVSPSELDRAIIQRAAAILSSVAVWNRADNRQCAPAATTWSIYCAMEKATVEVAGAFHHRRPALQLVRQIVDQRTAGRPYHHRLMDYNNDPSTHLEDVQSLFAEALRRMAS